MTDEDVLNILTIKNHTRVNTNINIIITKDIINYLVNRFSDIDDYREALYCLMHPNIDNKCPICGDKLKWTGKFYSKTCGNKDCIIKLSDKRGKQTKKELYGDENYNNREKYKQTYNSKSDVEKQYYIDKQKHTKLLRYNSETFVNPDKAKQTKKELYGDENYNNIEKIKKTYNSKSDNEKINIVIKRKSTNLLKYNSETFVNPDKAKQTKKELYGDENYNNREKAKSTMFALYNAYFFPQSQLWKEIISNPEWQKHRKQKEIETKLKNNTFNTSKVEDECYILLKKIYPDIIRQYKDNRYPFNCDFYIPSIDLFIECNFHWTHGGKPFEGTNEDLQKVKKWRDANSKYYNNAINTWINLDVRKQNIAKQNKLNYIIFWNLIELNEWIKSL